VLIYLIIFVNFQSWLDPFIIITALPGALAGIVWMLFVIGTTLSVPALTGAIMCMGIAIANSILLVSFAREGLENGLDATTAALESGFTRFRPVLMTALAMIVADGAGDGRGWRTERVAWPRRDRRTCHRNHRHAVLRSDCLQRSSPQQERPNTGDRRYAVTCTKPVTWEKCLA